MPKVLIPNAHAFESSLRRFKRACEKAGIVANLRRKEFYEKPAAERKRLKSAAVKRNLKRLAKEREAMERERTRK